MSRQSQVRNDYPLIAVILLVALLLRAMIPVGFMPAPGRPFGLQLCRAEIFSFNSHSTHAGGHSHFDSCPFGAAPAAGPVSDALAPVTAGAIAPPRPAIPRSVTICVPAVHNHGPRGPPLAA